MSQRTWFAASLLLGKYSLNRSMLLVAKADAPRKVHVFLDYVLGDCQTTVKDMGFVPVRAAR